VVVEADPFVDVGTFLLVGKIRLTEAEAVVGGEGIPVELKEGGEGGGRNSPVTPGETAFQIPNSR
jgi:hypothetical protein